MDTGSRATGNSRSGIPGNSREFGIAKFPAGIPGNFAKIAIGYFFPVISLFVQFHYHLGAYNKHSLSVNYNVLSIKLPTVKVKKNRNRPTCIRREN